MATTTMGTMLKRHPGALATKRANTRCHLTAIAAALIAALPLAWSGASHAQMPSGGTVAQGSATITQTSPSLQTIGVATSRAVINWDSFSIGAGNTVQFVQPNSSAIVLNRVTGGSASSILGNLTANGQVFLVNPNGIFFGSSARVDVAGLVASTMDIADADFMAGVHRFARPSGVAGASVVNEGVINAVDGGYVALLGNTVTNGASGIIRARLGTVLLAAADQVTLDFAGDQLISYALDTPAVTAATVANHGQILADGASVYLTTANAASLTGTVINQSGVIRAQSIVERDGGIYLVADYGNIEVAGTLDASAQTGGQYGAVNIVAQGGDVTLGNSAVIAAGGAAAGSNFIYGANNVQLGGTITAQSSGGSASNTLIALNTLSLGNAVISANGNTDAAGYLFSLLGDMTQATGGSVSASTTGDGSAASILSNSFGGSTLAGELSASSTGAGGSAGVAASSSTTNLSVGTVNASAPSGTANATLDASAGDLTATGTIRANSASGTGAVSVSGVNMTVAGIQTTGNLAMTVTGDGSGTVQNTGPAIEAASLSGTGAASSLPIVAPGTGSGYGSSSGSGSGSSSGSSGSGSSTPAPAPVAEPTATPVVVSAWTQLVAAVKEAIKGQAASAAASGVSGGVASPVISSTLATMQEASRPGDN